MKKTITILLLTFGFLGFCQQTKLTDADFINTDVGAKTEKEVSVINGDDKSTPIKVDFQGTIDQLKYLTLDRLNSVIEKENKSAKYSLKNKSAYEPKKVIIKCVDNNYWLIGFEYTAQNDYGATKDGTYIAKYTKEGKFIESY